MPVMPGRRAASRTSSGPDKGPREWVLLWGLHTPVSRFVTHPLYVLAVGTVGLFGLHSTPLFGAAMGSQPGPWCHWISLPACPISLHGSCSAWIRAPVRFPPGRADPVAGVHIAARILRGGDHDVPAAAGCQWFSGVQPPWLTDAVKDSADGGIAWARSPTLIVMIVVAIQLGPDSDDRAAKLLTDRPIGTATPNWPPTTPDWRPSRGRTFQSKAT